MIQSNNFRPSRILCFILAFCGLQRTVITVSSPPFTDQPPPYCDATQSVCSTRSYASCSLNNEPDCDVCGMSKSFAADRYPDLFTRTKCSVVTSKVTDNRRRLVIGLEHIAGDDVRALWWSCYLNDSWNLHMCREGICKSMLFKICDVDSLNGELNQACFDRNSLRVSGVDEAWNVYEVEPPRSTWPCSRCLIQLSQVMGTEVKVIGCFEVKFPEAIIRDDHSVLKVDHWKESTEQESQDVVPARNTKSTTDSWQAWRQQFSDEQGIPVIERQIHWDGSFGRSKFRGQTGPAREIGNSGSARAPPQGPVGVTDHWSTDRTGGHSVQDYSLPDVLGSGQLNLNRSSLMTQLKEQDRTEAAEGPSRFDGSTGVDMAHEHAVNTKSNHQDHSSKSRVSGGNSLDRSDVLYQDAPRPSPPRRYLHSGSGGDDGESSSEKGDALRQKFLATHEADINIGARGGPSIVPSSVSWDRGYDESGTLTSTLPSRDDHRGDYDRASGHPLMPLIQNGQGRDDYKTGGQTNAPPEGDYKTGGQTNAPPEGDYKTGGQTNALPEGDYKTGGQTNARPEGDYKTGGQTNAPPEGGHDGSYDNITAYNRSSYFQTGNSDSASFNNHQRTWRKDGNSPEPPVGKKSRGFSEEGKLETASSILSSGLDKSAGLGEDNEESPDWDTVEGGDSKDTAMQESRSEDQQVSFNKATPLWPTWQHCMLWWSVVLVDLISRLV